MRTSLTKLLPWKNVFWWGYSVQCVDEAFQAASSKTCSDLLQKSVKKDKSYSVSFISTYTPQAYILKNTILKYWPILTSDPAAAQHFKDPPLFAYRRDPHLRNKVVQANIKVNSKQTPLAPLKDGNYPCGHCAQCHNTWRTPAFRHPRSGKSFFPVKGFITRSTENVIYLL